MKTQTRLVVVGVAVLFVFIGCGEDGTDMVECEQQITALNFDETSDLGFSAEELLNEIAESGDVALEWLQDGESTDLEWDFSSDDEEVYFVEKVSADGGQHDEACSGDFVSVGGTLEVHTEDGKLQETISAELAAESEASAEISETMPLDQLAGTLEVDESGEDDLIWIGGELTEDGYNGTLAHDPYSEGEGFVTDEEWSMLAEWKPADEQETSTKGCKFDETELAVDEDTPLGFSADDVLAEVYNSGSTGLDWLDGGETEATWSFSQDLSKIYLSTETATDSDSDALCDSEFISIGGTLEFETEDGELDEELNVELRAESVDVTELAGELVISDINGELTVQDASDEDLVRFEGVIGADGSEGTVLLDGYDQSGDDNMTDVAHQPLGEWHKDS